MCVGALAGPFAGVAQAAPPNDEPRAASVPDHRCSGRTSTAEVVGRRSAGRTGRRPPRSTTQRRGALHRAPQRVPQPVVVGHVSEPARSRCGQLRRRRRVPPVVTLYDAAYIGDAAARRPTARPGEPGHRDGDAYVFPRPRPPQTYLVRVAQAPEPSDATARLRRGHAHRPRPDAAGDRRVHAEGRPRDPETRRLRRERLTNDDGSGLDVAPPRGRSRTATARPAARPASGARRPTPGSAGAAPGLRSRQGPAGNGDDVHVLRLRARLDAAPQITDFGVQGRCRSPVALAHDRASHDEPVTMHLTDHAGPRQLYGGNMRLLKGTKATPAASTCGRRVGADADGSASPARKDSAGNATVLPGCHSTRSAAPGAASRRSLIRGARRFPPPVTLS